MDYRLELHETPPSLNRFGSVGGGTYYLYRRLKKEWQDTLGTALMAAGVPRGLSKVSAEATMRFPTTRKRDEGNLRFLLEKVLGDTLVQGGWLADDHAGAFSFGAVSFDPAVGEPLTIIDLEVEPAGKLASPMSTFPNPQRESGDQERSHAAQATQPTQRKWRHRVKG